MHILCLGVNHHTAPVALREKLALEEQQVYSALVRLGCDESSGVQQISELVILSTCNRVEYYAVAPRTCFDPLKVLLAETSGVALEQFEPYLFCLSDQEVVTHLLRVAAGLESLILGEPQILGQVADALELARNHKAIGSLLSRLFEFAIRAGKRVRTETTIARNPASISSVAVRLAEEAFTDLPAARVLIVGAGEMAELAVEALRKRGVAQIQVLNRTLQRAHDLAQRWNAQAGTFESLLPALVQADIVIASTGAPHTIISQDAVIQAMQLRPQRPLIMIDIAVPRDIESQVANTPGVHLYDMDSLQAGLDRSLTLRASQAPLAEEILLQVQAEFEQSLMMLDVFPIIAEMHQRAEQLRQAELQKTLRRLPDLSEEEMQHLNALTQALVKKLLHAPITRLRQSAGSSQAAEVASLTRQLFDLDQPSNPNWAGLD
jgi:glutamyl-tRNA reductase